LSAIVRGAGLFSSTWTVTFSKPEASRWYWQRVLYNRRPHCLANGYVLVTQIVCGQGKAPAAVFALWEMFPHGHQRRC
jgi:hypothetical protein